MNGLMLKLDLPPNRDDPITVHWNDYADGGKVGVPKTLEVDMIIGADGANSRVAKDIDAGECDFAIAFQVRIYSIMQLSPPADPTPVFWQSIIQSAMHACIVEQSASYYGT